MLRLIWTLLATLPFIFFFFSKTAHVKHHPEKYTEEQRYEIAQFIVGTVKRKARITTDAFGMENLPQDGGYIMYSNHQGKYDAVGIIGAHEKPCTFIMEEARSHLLYVDQFVDLLGAVRLDRSDMRAQLKSMAQVSGEVRAGRRYIIFPEGGYDQNHNRMQEFMPGAFRCAVKSKCPIVPVALIDSYKPFGLNSLRPVRTQVHFLPPIAYEDYKEKSTIELAEMVRGRIADKIETILSQTA